MYLSEPSFQDARHSNSSSETEKASYSVMDFGVVRQRVAFFSDTVMKVGRQGKRKDIFMKKFSYLSCYKNRQTGKLSTNKANKSQTDNSAKKIRITT